MAAAAEAYGQDTEPEGSHKPPVPLHILIIIGILNGTGNFCASIGQPHTKGTTQSLISLAGIPVVLTLSWLFLGKSPTLVAAFAAALIVGATALSALPALTSSNTGDDGGAVSEYWYSVLIYFSAQLFWSSEKVLEEAVFKRYAKIDVLRMFMWTMWVQTILYFAYYPIQTVDAFGDLDLNSLPGVLRDGIRCTFGVGPVAEIEDDDAPPCASGRPAAIFFSYAVVDYCCYSMGLVVIKKGGANLMVLASAIALPLSQMVFCLRPIMGSLVEEFHSTDAAALGCALTGFYIYERWGGMK